MVTQVFLSQRPMNPDCGTATMNNFVLIVEDDEDIRELVSYHLLKEGYQVASVASGEEAIAAVMIESNFLGGTQDFRVRPLVPGRSVTDSCLAWEKTLPVLSELAESVRARRKHKRAGKK